VSCSDQFVLRSDKNCRGFDCSDAFRVGLSVLLGRNAQACRAASSSALAKSCECGSQGISEVIVSLGLLMISEFVGRLIGRYEITPLILRGSSIPH
jgi:hypothetical protein